jgi:hypothetical protein
LTYPLTTAGAVSQNDAVGAAASARRPGHLLLLIGVTVASVVFTPNILSPVNADLVPTSPRGLKRPKTLRRIS